MRKILGLLSCVMMASCSAGNDAAPSKAATTSVPLEKAHLVGAEVTEKYEQLLLKGYKLLEKGNYKAAIKDHFDPIIRYYTDKVEGKTDQTLYSVRGVVDSLHYMVMASGRGDDAAAISYIWAEALYLKGYTTLEVGGHSERG